MTTTGPLDEMLAVPVVPVALLASAAANTSLPRQAHLRPAALSEVGVQEIALDVAFEYTRPASKKRLPLGAHDPQPHSSRTCHFAKHRQRLLNCSR